MLFRQISKEPLELVIRFASLAPLRPMFDNPIRQRLLETDITTGFLRLDPFMPEYLLALSEILTVKGRILD